MLGIGLADTHRDGPVVVVSVEGPRSVIVLQRANLPPKCRQTGAQQRNRDPGGEGQGVQADSGQEIARAEQTKRSAEQGSDHRAEDPEITAIPPAECDAGAANAGVQQEPDDPTSDRARCVCLADLESWNFFFLMLDRFQIQDGIYLSQFDAGFFRNVNSIWDVTCGYR